MRPDRPPTKPHAWPKGGLKRSDPPTHYRWRAHRAVWPRRRPIMHTRISCDSIENREARRAHMRNIAQRIREAAQCSVTRHAGKMIWCGSESLAGRNPVNPA